MAEYVRVSSELIGDRLDPRYNSKKAISARESLLESGLELRSFSSLATLTCGPFGSTLTEDELDANGEVLLVQPTNISGDFFDQEKSWRLRLADLHAKGLSLYDPGTLLFARVGIYPHVGLVPHSAGAATISSKMIAATLGDELDARFAWSFFACTTGFTLLLAAQKITAQPTIGTSELGSTSIPVPEFGSQRYIGNKVRQAERLRAWARERESRILEDASDPEIERALGVLADNFHRVSARRIGHRLDPKYYDSKSLAVLDATSVDAVSVGEIAKSISNGFEERAFYATGIPYITVTEVASGRIDLENAPRIDSETEVPFRACINPKCVLVVRTGSIGTAVRVYAEDSGAVISSHFIRVEFETEAIASAVAAFLSSTAGRVLQHKISYGAVQPQIGQDELLALPIPKRLIDGAEELNGTAGHVDQAIRFSSSLTSAAKLLVEALIEGQITEQELIHAQQSQEAGDPGPDQAILARLKSDGLDGEGDPLFPDPERLQTLLERATADDADGEVADAT